jgi:hypothetical protein
MNNLAQLLKEQGDLVEAEHWYRTAIDLRHRCPPP